jgi:hypothetical protein
MIKRMLMLSLCSLLLSGLWLALAAPQPAYACSCAPPLAVKEELARKTAVFAGKVISVVQPKQGIIRSSANPVKVTFEVAEVWKGELKAETVVYTAISSASCGYGGFEANKDYIVFAHGSSERLETNLCERTKPLTSAGTELAELGAGYKPSGPSAVSDPQPSLQEDADGFAKSRSLQAIGSLGAILAAGVIILAIRRSRRS